MIRKTERCFMKKINKITNNFYDLQAIRRTTYWLFWIIPLFTKDEIESGKYEIN